MIPFPLCLHCCLMDPLPLDYTLNEQNTKAYVQFASLDFHFSNSFMKNLQCDSRQLSSASSYWQLFVSHPLISLNLPLSLSARTYFLAETQLRCSIKGFSFPFDRIRACMFQLTKISSKAFLLFLFIFQF